MRGTLRPLCLAAIVMGVWGCDSNQRLVELSQESLSRQAEQNAQMTRQSQAVTETTQQLIKAESAVQDDATQLEQQLHAERSALDRQRAGLDDERRDLAAERQRTPMIAESIKGVALLVASALPLVICWYLARALFLSAGEDSTAAEILLEQLAMREPLLTAWATAALLPPACSDRSKDSLASPLPCLSHRGEITVERAPHRVWVVVEDAHAVEFLKRISRVLAQGDATLPDLGQWSLEGTVAFIADNAVSKPALTNSSVGELKEFHLLTREIESITVQRGALARTVNSRPNCLALVTSKRALENYLHPDAICRARGVRIDFGDFDDVLEAAAAATFQADDGRRWTSLSKRARKRLRDRTKKWLNRAAVDQMTPRLLAERDPSGEVVGWLRSIAGLADAEPPKP